MREFSRLLLKGLALLIAAPVFLFYRMGGLFLGMERAFSGASQFLSLFPGFTGQLLRRGFYRMALRKSSLSSTIDFGTFFPSTDVVLGEHVYIGSHCILAPCVIGNDVLIGSGVHVMGGSIHSFDSLEEPIRLQGGNSEQIRIGRDSWIGNRAIVMADVGEGCVIGAGSVVTKPIGPLSIAVGNPARVIRTRA